MFRLEDADACTITAPAHAHCSFVLRFSVRGPPLGVCRLLADEGSYLSFGGKDGAPAPNAYEVLGVEPRVEAGAARRQFMKLSLWVHPDKNAHPRAVDAFHAADMAFKAIKARPHTQ